jgi:prepilin-type N-terminal cleavage/methylation domain-containing protein
MKGWKTQARGQGFSLVEIAVVLVIVGVAGAVLVRALPGLQRWPIVNRMSAAPLERAQQALDGFVLANSRLPCPARAEDGTGLEDCSAGHQVGLLPVATLGLQLPAPIRYGVFRQPGAVRDADLATLVERYSPLLPTVLYPHMTILPDPVTAPAVMAVAPVNLNGLDFCAGLRNAMLGAASPLSAGGVPIAYGLAVAGRDADGDGDPFDGANRVAGAFAPQGDPQRADFDDSTRTMGLGQLFGRLGCASRQAGVNGAARAAFVAWDNFRTALMVRDFRQFQVTVRESSLEMAKVNVALAGSALAGTIATTASGIALVVQTAGVNTTVLSTATLAIVVSTAGVASAALSLVNAESALRTARNQSTAASAYVDAAQPDYCAPVALQRRCAAGALPQALALDLKGLLP